MWPRFLLLLRPWLRRLLLFLLFWHGHGHSDHIQYTRHGCVVRVNRNIHTYPWHRRRPLLARPTWVLFAFLALGSGTVGTAPGGSATAVGRASVVVSATFSLAVLLSLALPA